MITCQCSIVSVVICCCKTRMEMGWLTVRCDLVCSDSVAGRKSVCRGPQRGTAISIRSPVTRWLQFGRDDAQLRQLPTHAARAQPSCVRCTSRAVGTKNEHLSLIHFRSTVLLASAPMTHACIDELNSAISDCHTSPSSDSPNNLRPPITTQFSYARTNKSLVYLV